MARKKTKSHRQTLQVKYMVNKKCKNERKKTAKLARQNPHLVKKSTKDPGVPNLWPFKEQLVRQMANKKEQLKDQAEADRLARKADNAARYAMIAAAAEKSNAPDAMEDDDDNTEEKTGDHNAGSGRRWYYKELHKVLDTSDVILFVLDARDPEGCRSRTIEDKIVGEMSARSPRAKKIIFVLNKIDLVPREVAEQWLTHLRRSFPTIAFKASTQSQKRNLTISKGKADKANDDHIAGSGSLGADTLLQLLKNYSRSLNLKTSITVGLVGYPNTGKSSIINSLKRSRAVHTGAMPGLTTNLQTVHLDGKIKLIDSPGILFNDDHDAALRNAIKVEQIEDPVSIVDRILSKFPHEQLMSIYSIARFADVSEFLFRIAHKRGKLGKGGVPDLEQAARIIINDWNAGIIPYYSLPPQTTDDGEHDQAVHIVDEWATALDLDAMLRGEVAASPSTVFVAIENPSSILLSDRSDAMSDGDDHEEPFDFNE